MKDRLDLLDLLAVDRCHIFPNNQLMAPTLVRPGTRLVRQWRDEVPVVNVEANGYEHQGARYQSLSEIARLITGNFVVRRAGAQRR